MRADPARDPARRRAPLHDRVDRSDRQPPAAAAGEERSPLVASGQVRLQRGRGTSAVRDDALLAALAEDADRLLRVVEAADVEAGHFGDAEARGVEELEKGDVASAIGAPD